MIDKILSDHRHFHSDWQIDYAITNRAGGTLYGCYRQSVRETHKRWRGLRELYRQRSLAVLDIDELEESEPPGLRNQIRREIELTEKRLNLVEADGVIRDTEREFLRFAGQAIACRRQLGLDDSEAMPEDMRQRLDEEFWENEIKRLAALDLITTGRIGRSTVELLASTAPEMRRRLADAILHPDAHERLIAWYLQSEPALPAPVEFSQDDKRRVLECVSRISYALPENGTPEELPSSRDANTVGA